MKWFGIILPVALVFSFYIMSEKGEHGIIQETVLENGNSSEDDSVEDHGRERDQALQEAERQTHFNNRDHSCLEGRCPDSKNRSIDSHGRTSWRMIVP